MPASITGWVPNAVVMIGYQFFSMFTVPYCFHIVGQNVVKFSIFGFFQIPGGEVTRLHHATHIKVQGQFG
tara:strand:+ start:374 stop:583 length:210 start_codon:yes stop_codon:yes gene_type:complete